MFSRFTVAHFLCLVAAILFAIAFCVAEGWFWSNVAAWVTAGLVCLAASELPWRSAP